jgi:wyosine [tRNA(Phe)-imidazoG37] synthetase (radical SAM superfamily)
MEIMLIKGVNDCQDSLNRYAEMLKSVRYDKLYLNTLVRPPAEINVEAIDHQTMNREAKFLDGISIDLLESQGFHSEITDHYESILSIIKRHPMNQFEIVGFLKSRDCISIENIFIKLQEGIDVEIINYKGYNTYRLK